MNLNKIYGGDVTRMAGSEGTFDYKVVAASARGRIGVRKIGCAMVRIRLEPAPNARPKILATLKKELNFETGWKQPGSNGQNRFSAVQAAEQLEPTLELLRKLIGDGELKTFAVFEN